MDLISYINKHENSLRSFAKRLDMHQPTLWRIANGKCRPSGENILKIVEGTDGLVSLRDLLNIRECITKEHECQENN